MRYAMHLPSLVRTATNPLATQDVRLRAVAACNAHVHNLAKNLSKLQANLKHAFPKPVKPKSSPEAPKPAHTDQSGLDQAEQISQTAHEVTRRIFHFVHPEHHTVVLSELRQPVLLDDLSSLEKMVLEFQKALPALYPGK